MNERIQKKRKFLTVAGITGIDNKRETNHTTNMAFRQLLIVQRERLLMGNTITMNLEKRKGQINS